MEFNFKLEAHDTWKLSTRAFDYSKRLRTSRFWFYFMLSCIFFLYSLGDQPFIYSVTQTFIWCALIFPITIRTLHFFKDKVFRNVKDLEQRRLLFNNDGVEQISSSKKQFFVWDLFDEAAEDIDYFFLFDKEKKAIAIPKRVVGDQEKLESLRNLLTDHVHIFTKHEPSPIREFMPKLRILILVLVIVIFIFESNLDSPPRNEEYDLFEEIEKLN